MPEGREIAASTSRARAAPGPRRDLLRPCLREPRPRPSRWGSSWGGWPSGSSATASSGCGASARGGTQPGNWKIVIETTSGYHVPIAHPVLMRLLDYKHYDVEVTTAGSGSRRRCATSPRTTPWSASTRLVAPRRAWPGGPAGLAPVMIYPNTTIDLYPDQVATWRIDPDWPRRPVTRARYCHPRAGLRTRLAQFANNNLNTLVGNEDYHLVENVQAGLETRGFELGPLRTAKPRSPGSPSGSARISVRSRRRRSAAPASASSRQRSSGSRATASTSPDARIAMDAGVSTSLIHYHFETRDACSSRPSSTLTSWPATCGWARRGRRAGERPAARGDDRPVPALSRPARARLDPLGRALAAPSGPASGDAPDGGASQPANARMVRARRSRPASSGW